MLKAIEQIDLLIMPRAKMLWSSDTIAVIANDLSEVMWSWALQKTYIVGGIYELLSLWRK